MMLRLAILAAFSMSALAQRIDISPPKPPAAKSGEERTPFLTKDGKPCGTLAQQGRWWYFYHDFEVSGIIETRPEAVKWALAKCPKQGTVVVAK